MVHLFRGIGGRGRGFPRPPVMMLRHMRPQGYESDFIPPCPYGLPRGNFFNRPPIRPRPMPPPRMVPPPRLRPPPPHPPLRDMHYPPIHLPGRHLGIPPLIPPGPPLRRPMQPQPSIRGRGGFTKRGVSVKRLVPASGRAKKNQNRKEKTEEMETSKPWMTETLKSEIHKKYQLYEIAKVKETESDWQAYKDQRILVGKIRNTAKLEYIGLHPESDADLIMFGSTPKRLK